MPPPACAICRSSATPAWRWNGSRGSTIRAWRSCAQAFDRFKAGQALEGPVDAFYPFLGIAVTRETLNLDARLSFGAFHDPGIYGTTLTRPQLFAEYYRRQIELLLQHHGVPVVVGISERRMPLPFVIDESTADIRHDRVSALQMAFPLPEMSLIDDAIANGTHRSPPGVPKPLALFTAERVDYSLERLHHYTATAPEHVQRFILLTNYQRYVEHFVDYAERAIAESDEFESFVEPGNVVTSSRRRAMRRRAAAGRAICRRCRPTT